MWRKKSEDLALIQNYLKDLKEFQEHKKKQWEQIDDEVQMTIRPGTPSEDWIIPPDENRTLNILNNDPDYRRLKDNLLHYPKELKKIAKFIHLNAHHDFDWINFNNPLIGNAALEDGLKMGERLYAACKKSNYFFRNLTNFY